MKLLTLNVWGGRKEKQLADFFEKYKNKIDVFCLQEVNHNAAAKSENWPHDNVKFFQETEVILDNYTGYFRPSIENHYGLATFVRDDILVKNEAAVFVSGTCGRDYDLENGKDHPRNVQHLEVGGGDNFLLHNFHGMWTKKGKIDTPERIEQAKNVAEHLGESELPQIIAGDFNMRPNTKSVKIIESAGLRNLIKEFDVTDTRTKFYEKEERFADYILVSDGIQVNDFKVLGEEVSDHAPLYLDFDII
jgi:endonuclease/exonuclease/phosphatase family metal-dependent hydrolase